MTRLLWQAVQTAFHQQRIVHVMLRHRGILVFVVGRIERIHDETETIELTNQQWVHFSELVALYERSEDDEQRSEARCDRAICAREA